MDKDTQVSRRPLWVKIIGTQHPVRGASGVKHPKLPRGENDVYVTYQPYYNEKPLAFSLRLVFYSADIAQNALATVQSWRLIPLNGTLGKWEQSGKIVTVHCMLTSSATRDDLEAVATTLESVLHNNLQDAGYTAH